MKNIFKIFAFVLAICLVSALAFTVFAPKIVQRDNGAGFATAASNSAARASSHAKTAEAYALGTKNGEAVGFNDPTFHNNAKYWAGEAEDSASAAIDAASDASDFADVASNSADNALGFATSASSSATSASSSAMAASNFATQASDYANNAKYYAEEVVAAEAVLANKANIDGFYEGMTVGHAIEAETIATDREIEDADEACPPITFGAVGGNAEIQDGYSAFKELRGNTIISGGTLLSSKSASMILRGRNQLNLNRTAGTLSGLDASTPRAFEEGKYYAGLNPNNNYYAENVSNITVNSESVSYTTANAGGYGIGFPCRVIPGQSYLLQTKDISGNRVDISWYDKDGNFISATNSAGLSVIMAVAPINAYWGVVCLDGTTGTHTYTEIQFRLYYDTPNLPYVPYEEQVVTLPNIELRSFGDVYDVAYQEGGGKRRIGIRAYESGDESDPNVLTDGTNTIYVLTEETDITLEENAGWQEFVKVNNFGTIEFTTSSVQNPQVPQAYFIRYTVNLVEFLDSAYVRCGGDANNIMLKSENVIPNAPTTDGNYILKVSVSGGVPTYFWEVENNENY